jgi:uncharacterized protein (TIGR02300 family)
MSNAERGTKRVCSDCGEKYFDLNHDPIVCPLCEAVFVPPVVKTKPVARRGPSSWYQNK